MAPDPAQTEMIIAATESEIGLALCSESREISRSSLPGGTTSRMNVLSTRISR